MTAEDAVPGLVGFALRRHWRVVLAVTVAVGLLASAVLLRQPAHTYRVTKGYLVALEKGEDPTVITDQSDRFARDYASVLRTDSAVLDEIGDRIGTSGSYVRRHLKVAYVPSSSTIVIRFESSKRAEVTAAFAALDTLVEVDGIPTRNIGPGLLRSLGTPPTVTLTNPLRRVPGTGFVLGLLVALGVAVLLERIRPRIINRAHLQSMTDRSTLSVDQPDGLEVLAVRVLGPMPTRVVLTAADGTVAAAARLSLRLTAVAASLAEGRLDRAVLDVPFHVEVNADPDLLSDAVQPGDCWLVLTDVGSPLHRTELVLQALDAAADLVVVLGDVPRAAAPALEPVAS
jgi:capsular polysaccharide biosynthesis protein